MRRSSPTSQFRSVGRIAAWFGSLGGRDVSTGSAPSTAPTPEGTAVTPAPAAGSAGTDSTTTAPQPVVKTAHEYALSRLEVLGEFVSIKKLYMPLRLSVRESDIELAEYINASLLFTALYWLSPAARGLSWPHSF